MGLKFEGVVVMHLVYSVVFALEILRSQIWMRLLYREVFDAWFFKFGSYLGGEPLECLWPVNAFDALLLALE